MKLTSSISSFGIFADYPTSIANSVLPQINSGLAKPASATADICRMHPRVAILVSAYFGLVIAGLAIGLFSFTLGSFLIWGAIVIVGLATLARFVGGVQWVGGLLSLVWTGALPVFLVQLVL